MSSTSSQNSFSTCSFIASMTVLLYDLLLLLPTEINYVWLPRPVHPLLLLFALNRYLPLVNTAMTINWLLHESSAAQCRLLAFITVPLAAVCIFASQVILMIRTYAMWDRHRVVFWCFIGIGIFCFIPEIVGLGLHLRTIQFAGPFNHPDCLSPSSNVTKLLYIPVIISETIIALLTLFKAIQHLRRSSHPFLKELYVSGMFFYASILFITLANILLPMWVPGIALFLGAFQSIIHSILSNRILLLILRQRRIRRHHPTEELCSSDVELSDITSSGPGSENEVKNVPGIWSYSDGRIQPTGEMKYTEPVAGSTYRL